MNYSNNINDLSQLKYINRKNQLSKDNKLDINNPYFISDVNQKPTYSNYKMHYSNNIPINIKNNNIKNNVKNNAKYISLKTRSLFIEELKNYNHSNEYYTNYNYTPKNFNYCGTKELNHNKSISTINKSQNQNSLFDYLIYNQKDNNKIKILDQNQIQNISLNLLSNNNYLIQNKENKSFNKINHNQDISPIKNKIFAKKKFNNYNQRQNEENNKNIKKQIILLKRDNSYSYNSINNSINNDDKSENINNIPNIPENDNYNKYETETIFSTKKNKNQKRINIIPIPKKFRKINAFETRRKLFYSNNQNNNIYTKPTDNRNGSSSGKKNLINIDINLDFDKNAQKSFYHKKIKSSFILENNSFIEQMDDDKHINNISTISKSPQSYSSKKLCKYNSAKSLNKNIKSNELKIKNNIENGAIRKVGKDVKIKKRNQKSNDFIKFKSLNDIDNSYNINRVNRINRTLNALPTQFRILWGGKSQAGKDSNGNSKINQDAFKVYENVNFLRNFNIFILSDGHGKDGHHVSHFVVENLKRKIQAHPSISSLFNLDQIYQKLKEHNYRIIKNIFSEIDQYLSEQKKYDTYTSGATCVLIIQIGNKIICANLGDSRAILIYEDSDDNNNESNILYTKVFQLSLDSKPDLPSEKNRIINCGGEVHKGKNKNGIFAGPMRVFPKGESCSGLAMSRSLGDFKMKQYGVINEPSFVEYNLDEFSKYIVLCSDGVCDFMDNETIMKIGNKHFLNNSPNGFCEEVIGNATYWWEKEDIVIDDITALIIFFKNY